MNDHATNDRTELLKLIDRLVESVGRATGHATRALEEAARLGAIVTAQQGEIDKLGAAVQVHQQMFEVIANKPASDGPQLH